MTLDGRILGWAATPAIDGDALLAESVPRRTAHLARVGRVAGLDGVTEELGGTPGSVAKLLVAAAAAETETETRARGQLGARWTLPDGSGTIRNAWAGPCPSARLVMALAYSCNTTFADLAIRMGAAKVTSTARDLGLGEAVEVAPGLRVPPAVIPENGRNDMDTASIALGASPTRWSVLHAAMVAAVMADGGLRVYPTLVPGQARTGPRVLPEQAAGVVMEGMRAAVSKGTARQLSELGTPVAAKTGTASDGSGRAEPWIVAVAGPAGQQVVVAVHLRPRVGSTGGHDAAPVALAVLSARFPQR